VLKLTSRVRTQDPVFRERDRFHRARAAELAERLAVARAGGGAALAAKHTARGKLMVRDRIERLRSRSAFLPGTRRCRRLRCLFQPRQW
jgi:acetyl-CoA carboxylase carboxyltransferase component